MLKNTKTFSTHGYVSFKMNRIVFGSYCPIFFYSLDLFADHIVFIIIWMQERTEQANAKKKRFFLVSCTGEQSSTSTNDIVRCRRNCAQFASTGIARNERTPSTSNHI